MCGIGDLYGPKSMLIYEFKDGKHEKTDEVKVKNNHRYTIVSK